MGLWNFGLFGRPLPLEEVNLKMYGFHLFRFVDVSFVYFKERHSSKEKGGVGL